METQHDRTASPTSCSRSPTGATARSAASYALASDQRLMITTDRLSAFDRVIAAVPYKGQVLNQLSAWWFDADRRRRRQPCRRGARPQRPRRRAARPLPVEVVVRGYITGVTDTSLWRQYAEGARTIYGHRFPRRAGQEHAAARTDRHAHHEGRARRPRRADHVRRGRRPAASLDADALGAGHGGRPRGVPPRDHRGARGWADPRRHQVRVRSRNRRFADADRRVAHARLVAVVGRRQL